MWPWRSSSTSAQRFANGLLARLFLLRSPGLKLELAGLDLLRGRDRLVGGLRVCRLAAAGHDDPERDLAPLDLLVLTEVSVLAQLVDEGAGGVVALGLEALVELAAGVAGGVDVLVAARGKAKNAQR